MTGPDASKIPARIWTGPELVAATRTWGMHEYSKKVNASVAFVRADIAEQLAEALRQCEGALKALGAENGYAAQTARKSLSAYDASNGDRQAGEAHNG